MCLEVIPKDQCLVVAMEALAGQQCTDVPVDEAWRAPLILERSEAQTLLKS